MTIVQPEFSERRVAEALARRAYADNVVRVASLDIADCIALVSCGFGVYAITKTYEVQRILYGRFHGIRHQGDHILIFEVCDRARNRNRFGRILRLDINADRLGEPQILARGLDNQVHQLAMFDGMIHVVDTANQAIVRLTPQGEPIDEIRPFPFTRGDTGAGDYHHINSIARIGDRIGVMLHNGKLKTTGGSDRQSEVAWFTQGWELLELQPLAGFGCHDIVSDSAGVVWHSGSMAGELLNSNRQRFKVTDRMTRGLAFAPDLVLVGASLFGDRVNRDAMTGQLLLFDRKFSPIHMIDLPSAPMDLIAMTNDC